MAAKVERFEQSDLPEQQKAAIRLADAMMTQPGSISDELRDDLRRHFTDDQLVEITVDIMKWNYQKVPVALGADDVFKPGELAEMAFDEHGHFIPPS